MPEQATKKSSTPLPFSVSGISKSFGTAKVLSDVSLKIEPGSIHALMGANGSGKSTLAKIVAGVHRPDQGVIEIGPVRRTSWSGPSEAAAHGIAVVHQEAPLVNSLSVLDVVALAKGWQKTPLGGIRWRATNKEVRRLLDRFAVPVDTRTVCGKLSGAERAMVAMAMALDGENTSLLILDEATAAIPQGESNVFLDRVDRVRERDIPVLMVSHRIAEVRNFASTMTILADGRVVYDGPVSEISDEAIVGFMLASVVDKRDPATSAPVRQVSVPAIPEASAPVTSSPQAAVGVATRTIPAAETATQHSEPLVRVQALSGGRVREATFDMYPGEILGVCGLADGGVEDLPELLAGSCRAVSGTVSVLGRVLRAGFGPRHAIAAGISHLPRDRTRDGVLPTLTLRENMMLSVCGEFWRKGKIERRTVSELISALNIQPANMEIRAGRLSGGNQQKVLLARCFLEKPSVLVLSDPTYGIDPGSRNILFEAVHEHVEREQMCVLLMSTEPEHLAIHCSRVLVLHDGEIVDQLEGDRLTVEAVAKLAAI